MKPQLQPVVIEGRLLTDADRDVIQVWSKQALPKSGDVRLNLTEYQGQSFGILLFMLGLLRYQE